MFGNTKGQQLLAELFSDQYGSSAGPELCQFLEHLSRVDLPFDLAEQMRKREYPGFPGFECGLPPTYYYFVARSCYGGHTSPPDDPLDPAFVASVDGIGLNFGCPLRLKRALNFLLSLREDQQVECRCGLKTASKHLATVEELIWGGVWKSQCHVVRPDSATGKCHDWRIETPEMRLNLECKFVPASWAKLVDGEDFQLMSGTLAGKASKQLPVGDRNTINVVAVTGIAPVDNGFRILCQNELRNFSNVQAILYADMAGQATVFSLSSVWCDQVRNLIEPWRADEFRGFATVVSCRLENARRSAARSAQKKIRSLSDPVKFVELPVQCLPPRRVYYAPPAEYPYRFDIERRLETGEPIFRYVPPFLPSKI